MSKHQEQLEVLKSHCTIMLACNRSESNNVQSELLSRTNCSQVKSFLLSSQLEMISSLVGMFFSKPSALTSSQHQVNQTTTRSKQRTVQLAMQPQQALHLGKALRSTNSARENLLRSQTCFLKAYIYIYISYIIYIYNCPFIDTS